MNTDNLNYLDQAQGVMPWDSNVSPQGLIAQRRAQAFAAPMAFPDSSGALNAGQDSQNQAMKTMNTQGVGQTQLSHGLIGRSFDTAKTDVLDGITDGKYSKSKETYANVQNMMNGGFANSSGTSPALENYTQGKMQDTFGIKPTTAQSPGATSTTQPSTPTSKHLGDHVGNGYYKLNNSYFQ